MSNDLRRVKFRVIAELGRLAVMSGRLGALLSF